MDRPARRQRRPDGHRASGRRLRFLHGRLTGRFGRRLFVPGDLNVCARGWWRRRLCGFHGVRFRRAFLGRLAFRFGFSRCVETVETTQLYRYVFIDRAGVRLFFRYAEFW
jgi:hypothetical protein